MYFWRIVPAVTQDVNLTCVDWYYYSTKQPKELSKKNLKVKKEQIKEKYHYINKALLGTKLFINMMRMVMMMRGFSY